MGDEVPNLSVVQPRSLLSITQLAHSRSTWYSLLSLLFHEAFRPFEARNHLALELGYFIIYSMLHSDDLSNHTPSILLLPQILIEMDLLDACYDFLKRIQLKRIPRNCEKDLQSFSKDNEEILVNITEPIQVFCDEKCDPLLLLDFIYIKIQQGKRICEMQTFAKEWKSLMRSHLSCQQQSKRILRAVEKSLGVSQQWNQVNLNVLERQALDLVKLVSRIHPTLLPTLMRRFECDSGRDGRQSFHCLHPSFWKWYRNTTAIEFVKEALVNCPQTSGVRM